MNIVKNAVEIIRLKITMVRENVSHGFCDVFNSSTDIICFGENIKVVSVSNRTKDQIAAPTAATLNANTFNVDYSFNCIFKFGRPSAIKLKSIFLVR